MFGGEHINLGRGTLTQPKPDEFGMRQRSGEYFAPNSMLSLVEASHANAHARAIAFFSYIWFKYILSSYCCKVRSAVDNTLSYQLSVRRFDSRLGSECVLRYAETGKEMHETIFICFKTLHYT